MSAEFGKEDKKILGAEVGIWILAQGLVWVNNMASYLLI